MNISDSKSPLELHTLGEFQETCCDRAVREHLGADGVLPSINVALRTAVDG